MSHSWEANSRLTTQEIICLCRTERLIDKDSSGRNLTTFRKKRTAFIFKVRSKMSVYLILACTFRNNVGSPSSRLRANRVFVCYLLGVFFDIEDEVRLSVTSVNLYETALRHIPEATTVCGHRLESLKTYMVITTFTSAPDIAERLHFCFLSSISRAFPPWSGFQFIVKLWELLYCITFLLYMF
jgi:hypothetical protein